MSWTQLNVPAWEYWTTVPEIQILMLNLTILISLQIIIMIIFVFFYFNKTLCGQIKPMCVLKLGCDHQLGILDLKLSGRCDGKIGGQKSVMFI